MNRYNNWKDKTPVRPFLKSTQTKKVDNPILFWGAISVISIFTAALIYILVGIAL
jgi:hypothetical protein